jgi:hypothetical protein
MTTAIATVVSLAALATTAQAQTTFGQIVPGGPPTATPCTKQEDLVQVAVFAEPKYESPGTGVITSWSTNAAANPGQELEFKVFETVDTGGVFKVVAHDGPHLLSPGINTFKVHIPITSRDQIGINPVNASTAVPSACRFLTGKTADESFTYPNNAADGAQIQNPGFFKEERVNVSATFLAPPEVRIGGRVSLGSITGGTAVALSGFNFSEVSAVSFGGVPATKFTVDSEQQITAVAPPGKTLDEIAAEVTTPAGTAATPARFAYTGCLVPKLTGKKLKAATTSLKGAGCRLGKVKRLKHAKRKTGKVRKQSPGPGKVLAPGSKVNVTLGK